jgi:hypothetical protein
VYERPRIGGDRCDGSFSEMASLLSAGRCPYRKLKTADRDRESADARSR